MVRELYLDDIAGRWLGVVMEKAPKIPIAQEAGEWLEVAGMNGELWRADGGLKAVELEAQLYVRETANLSEVMAWLRNATRLRWDGTDFYYRVSGVELEGELEEWEDFVDLGWEVTVKWKAEPFRYVWPASELPGITDGVTLHNGCNVYASPVIDIHCGSSGGILAFGRYTVTLDDTFGLYRLDCGAKLAYGWDETAQAWVGAGTSVTLESTGIGRWPRINVGDTAIGFTSGVTSIDIVPNWRNV